MKNRYGGTETALMRHETFQRGFNRIVIALLAMSIAIVSLVGVSTYVILSKPEPRYFATRDDGGILPLTPISEPFLTDSQITNFSVEAITRALTIDFANWRRDLSEASEYFVRPDGWNNYLTAMEGSGVLEFIKTRRLVSTAVANGATITSAGMVGGRYSWTVQIPLTVTYESSSETTRDDLIAEARIVRVPTWQVPSGVAISLLVVKTGRAQEK